MKLKLILLILLTSFTLSIPEKILASEQHLIKALAKHNIQLPESSNYSDIVDHLSRIEHVPNLEKKKQITNYLHRTIYKIVKIETSKPGILNWYVENIIFLPSNLLFVEYNDGEINGGELLLEIEYHNGKITDMVIIWDSHK